MSPRQRPTPVTHAFHIAALAVVLSVLPISNSFASWTKIAQFTSMGRVSATCFLNGQVGFVGFQGPNATNRLLRTTDGGLSWTAPIQPAFPSSGTSWFGDIWFRNASEGWAAFFFSSTGSNLWHTTDGGLSWSNAGILGNCCSVRQTSHAVCVNQFNGPGISVSTDGGTTFPSSFFKNQDGLDFVDDLHGVASGYFTPFEYTDDGGVTWHPSVTNFSNEGWGVFGIKGTSTFVAVPEDNGALVSKVYVSSDYGVNWSVATTLPFVSNGEIKGAGQTLFIQRPSGGTGLYRSTDLGLTWKNIAGPNESFDSRIAVTDCGNTIYAFDDFGGVYRSLDGGDGTVFPACPTGSFISTDLCDTIKIVYNLPNPVQDTLTILDFRITDLATRPVFTRAVGLDSTPNLSHTYLPADSIGFSIGWRPRLEMNVPGEDSVHLRMIVRHLHSGKLDTVQLIYYLFGSATPPKFSSSLQYLQYGIVPMCVTRDSVMTIANSGCDTLWITSASLIGPFASDWTVLDNLGRALQTPIGIPTGQTVRIHLGFATRHNATLYDTLLLRLRHQGVDTVARVSLTATGLFLLPLSMPSGFALGASTICTVRDSLIWLSNSGCDTLFITQTDLKSVSSPSAWAIFDSTGAALRFPIPIVPGQGCHLHLVYTPAANDSAKLTIHYRSASIDTLQSIPLSGYPVFPRFVISAAQFNLGAYRGCTQLDTIVTLSNLGCDTLRVLSAFLGQHKDWSLTDSAGNALSLPLTIPPQGTYVLHLHYVARSVAWSFDTLRVAMRELLKDTILNVRMYAKARLIDAVSAPAVVAFDSVPTCAALDSLLAIGNDGCDTMRITQADLKSADWTLFDSSGAAVKFPIVIPPGSHAVVRLHFAPSALGKRAALLNLHFHYLGLDSTHVIAINGIGKAVGTFDYNHSLDFGSVPLCASVDSMVTFLNSTCEKVLVDSLLVKSPFTLLDSSAIPSWVDPAKTTSFRIRYQPSKKSREAGQVILRLLLNGNIVYDTLALTGLGTSGGSSFYSSLSTGSIPFASRSECDHLDSVRFTLRNPGCDSLTIVSAVLENNVGSVFSIFVDRSLPLGILGKDSVGVTVALAKLEAGSFNSTVHIRYIEADGTSRDSLIPVSALITPGTRSLAFATAHGTPFDGSMVDFGTFNACATRDTTIIYTNTGCLPLTITRRALAGTGFLLSAGTPDTFSLAPGQSDTLHVSFDGQHTGDLSSTFILSSNADGKPIVAIPIHGTVPPLDSASFVLALSHTLIRPDETVSVTITPDRAVSNKKLFTIAGSLSYFGDAYTLVSISPMAGLDTQIRQQPQTGRIAHLQYTLSNSTDISLDPKSPILTARFVSRLTDSISPTPWALEDVQLNGSDPDFARCTLASSAANSPVVVATASACGDSLISESMRGSLAFRAEPAHPNPVTAQDGYATTLELRSGTDGTADIEVFDALGRSVAKSRMTLGHAATMPCRLDFTQLPAGSYFYSIRFHSVASDAVGRGSVVLIH